MGRDKQGLQTLTPSSPDGTTLQEAVVKLPRELVLWGCRRGCAPGLMKGFAQEIRGFAQDGAWNGDARRMSLEGPNSDQTFLWLHFAVASPVLAGRSCAPGRGTVNYWF